MTNRVLSAAMAAIAVACSGAVERNAEDADRGLGQGGAPCSDCGAGGTENGSTTTGGAIASDVGGQPAANGAGGAVVSDGIGGDSAGGGLGGEPSTPPQPPPPWEPPAGCTVSTETVMDGYCGLVLNCPESNSVGCREKGGGSWRCQVYGPVDDEVIEIMGLGGIGACHSALSAFVTGEDSVFGGEEACEPEIRDSNASECEFVDVCVRSASPDSGIEGTLSRRPSVSCAGTPLSCECDSGDKYRVEGLEPELACARVFEHCASPAPAPVGDRQCTPAGGYWDPLDPTCFASATCTTWTEVEPGISSVNVQIPAARCATNGICTCGTDSADYFRFETGERRDKGDISLCQRWAPACAAPVAIEAAGPLECENGDVFSEEVSCSIARVCEQAATFDDQAINISERMDIRCTKSERDGFQCACDDGEPPFAVEASSPEEACSSAHEACPDSWGSELPWERRP